MTHHIEVVAQVLRKSLLHLSGAQAPRLTLDVPPLKSQRLRHRVILSQKLAPDIDSVEFLRRTGASATHRRQENKRPVYDMGYHLPSHVGVRFSKHFKPTSKNFSHHSVCYSQHPKYFRKNSGT